MEGLGRCNGTIEVNGWRRKDRRRAREGSSRSTIALPHIRLIWWTSVGVSSNNSLHLHASLCFNICGCQVLALLRCEALITLLVWFLELKVCRWSGSCEYCNPISKHISLGERSETISFSKFMRVEIFACGFAAAHEPEMIEPECCWVWKSKSTVDNHCEWNSPFADRLAKGDVFALLVEKHMRQRSSEKEQGKNRGRADKTEKVPIIATANTIIEPHTVMI